MPRVLLALTLLLVVPSLVEGQTDSSALGVRLHLTGSWGAITVPPAHRLAATRLHSDPLGASAAWERGVRAGVDSARQVRAQTRLLRALYGISADTAADRSLLALGRRYTDLSIEGNAGVEVRSQRFKNERCTPYQLQDPASGCQGRFSAPRIDNDFVLRAGGVVGQRLHINIDYDNKRDFEAINDIRVYYQGLTDEIVQRVEVGTVTFTPPPSRFITAAIPAYSFGINSRFEFGPVTLGALAASQKGSAVTERSYTVGATTSQPQDRVLRDLDFEQGRFFWVVDPATIAGYPTVDVLNVSPGAVDESVRPVDVRLYRYRPSGGTTLGGIRAVGYRPDSDQRTGLLPWTLLVDGQDYVLDPSGLWVAFINRLDVGDYLAVSYQTASGAVVGSFPAQDDPAANDSLLLLSEPRRGPEVPTFRYEMRQVYRLAGTDLDRGSLKVDLTLNQSERPAQQGAATYLALLGIAIPTDPDVIDVANRVFPRARDVVATERMRESFIVFPALQPFADPTKLSPAERTDSLYRTPLYLILTQGPSPRFQFRLQYNAAGGGERSMIELNAFQIREGSEQIVAGGRVLRRDVDYSISYDLGRVTFTDPEGLFGTGQSTVTARFEERGIFAVAPTTIYGLTSTYRLGEVGSLNLIGIYQQENTVFTRPPVGFEPTANLVGGVTGDLRFKPAWPTRAMNALVSGGTAAPSLLDLTGEFAFTAPQGNRAGQAYLEEFEGDRGLQLSLRENAWGYAGRPEFGDGLEGIGLGGGLDSADAVQLTWQNLVRNANGAPVEVRTQDIDSLIRITGGAQPIETVLYFTLHADTAGGFVSRDNSSRWSLPQRTLRPRWRSMVTSLSPTGTDLTQSEFLEFWLFQGASAAADSAGVHLVVDLGTVGEDALAIAPESLVVTGTDSAWAGRRYAGVGRLDTERNETGVFNAQLDDNGILIDRPDSLIVNGAPVQDVATCSQALSSAVALYSWGDLSVRCTKGNGTLDTEDLNGDNVLDVAGVGDHVARYVIALGDPRYFVRSGGTGWKLYRVPLRQPDAALGAPNFRLIQHLRLTIAAAADAGGPDRVARFAVARLRLIGSPWVRRSDAPVLGLSGATAEAHGEVVVTTVSTENRELGYESPPGVLDEAARSDATGGQQINEHSLRIIGRDLREGERAEGYFRFVASPQNLLKYRSLRFWVRGRGDGWSDGRLQAVFKAASDHRNFYAYRIGAATDTWGPEVNVDLDIWRKLRADIETRWLQGLPPNGLTSGCAGVDSTAYVACQGPYLVQVADPGISPPNLAAVQEIDAAVHYAGAGAPLAEAELWVDDVRLVDPVNALGTATAFSARLAAADVADLTVGFVRQDGNFQQLGQDPTFRTTATTQVSGSVRLDRFLPTRLGLTMPATVSYTRSSIDPTLVNGTDLRAADLPGLRRPNASQWAWGMSVRRSRPGQRWVTRAFVDPVSVNGQYSTARSQTEYSQAATSSYGLGGAYAVQLRRQGPRLPLDGLVKTLPAWLRESPVGQGMKGSILALAPTSLRFTSGLTRSENSFTTYAVAVARPDDSLRTPTLNLAHAWQNSARVTFQPLGMLTLDGNLNSTRDLRHYSDSTPLGRLAEAERREFLGLDVGVERDRDIGTVVALTPVVATWLRPRYLRSSTFNLTRSLTSRDPVRIDGDSGAFLLPQTYSNVQSNELSTSVDLNRVAAMVAGDSSGTARFLRRLRPLVGSVRQTRNSTFDLATFDPSLGYMLALGGRDEFRSQGEETALSTAEVDEVRLGGAADLPGGVTLSLAIADILTRRSTRVGDGFAEGETRQREWPQGALRWSRLIRRGPVALLTLGGSIRRREGTTTTRSASGDALGRTVSGTYSPDMLLGFRNGISANLSFARSTQLTETSANRTEIGNDQWSATVSHSIRLPASLSPSRRALRASFNGQRMESQTCLSLASAPTLGCRTVADIRRLTLTGGFTTEVSALAEAGLNFQYVSNDIRHLNQLTTQLSIVASMRMQLSTGNLR